MYHTYVNVDYRKVAVGIAITMLVATMLFAAIPVALADPLDPCDGKDFGQAIAGKPGHARNHIVAGRVACGLG